MKSRRTQLSYLWNCSRQLRTAAFDCLSSVSESEDGDLHATMSANQSPARTFTEARDPCCSFGNRERQQRRSKGCQDWKRQSQEHERKERENVKGPGQVKSCHHVASFVTSLATWTEGRGQVKRDHHVASFVTSLAWPKGKGRSKGAITLLHF